MNPTPSIRQKVSKEFGGLLNYNKLVRLRNRLKFHMTDMIRLIHFKRETIETAIFQQDIIDGQIRGEREIKSFYLEERNKL